MYNIVGHCHPNVLEAASKAMLQIGAVSIGVDDNASVYINKLKTTLPAEYDSFLFVSSG